MNIICSKEKLLENVNIVLKAVPSRTTLPILECILIKTYASSIKLMANNLEMGIETAEIDAEIIRQGVIAVEAHMFSEIIRRLPDGNVSISTDDMVMTIKSGRSEFKLSVQKGDDFPVLPEIEKSNHCKLSAENFRNMIKKTIFSVSLDESKPVLTGELLEIKDKCINMVSLDGFRISFSKTSTEESYTNNNLIIPGKTLGDVLKILSSYQDLDINIYFTDKHVLFELDCCTIVSRLIDGKFLQYENIFTDDHTTLVKVNRQDFINSVERASLISKDVKKHPIKLKISEYVMAITSNTDVDAAYDELVISMDGNNLEIAFNPRYLLDVVKVIETDEITMQFTTPLNPCIIKPVNDDSENICEDKYLILPLRLK